MENQHRKITGYRELSQVEIDLMNEIKALGPIIEAVLMKVEQHLTNQKLAVNISEEELQRMFDSTPGRFLALAKTDMQTGLMYATRAVAQPTFF